jgi:hypothetical protein
VCSEEQPNLYRIATVFPLLDELSALWTESSYLCLRRKTPKNRQRAEKRGDFDAVPMHCVRIVVAVCCGSAVQCGAAASGTEARLHACAQLHLVFDFVLFAGSSFVVAG